MFEWSIYFGGRVVDDFLRCQVAFVADQQFVYVFIGIALDFLKPVANVLKRFLAKQHIKIQSIRGRLANTREISTGRCRVVVLDQ